MPPARHFSAMTEPALPGIAMIVLAWNGRDVVLSCLESLASEARPTDTVIMVDNGSSDDTVRDVRERFPKVRVIETGLNLGYAGGMNVGLRIALAERFPFILLLNQDTVIPPGTVSILMDAARRHPTFDAFQPLLVRLAAEGTIDSAGQRLHRVPGASDWLAGAAVDQAPTTDSEIFGPCGAAVLYRADAVRSTHLFDEDLFLLFEDVDLSFQMRLSGRRAMLVPSARVLHGRGISGAAQRRNPLRQFLVARNGFAMAIRFWPTHWLVLSAPILAVRALRALSLRGSVKRKCRPLWSRAWSERAAARTNAKRYDVDRWLVTKFVPATD